MVQSEGISPIPRENEVGTKVSERRNNNYESFGPNQPITFTLDIAFDSKYNASFQPMLLLALGGIFLGIRYAFAAFWEGVEKPLYSTADTVSGATLMLVLCFVFVFSDGYMGASFALLIGSVGAVLVSGFLLFRK